MDNEFRTDLKKEVVMERDVTLVSEDILEEYTMTEEGKLKVIDMAIELFSLFDKDPETTVYYLKQNFGIDTTKELLEERIMEFNKTLDQVDAEINLRNCT